MIEGEDGDVYCEVANLKGEDGGFKRVKGLGNPQSAMILRQEFC